MMLKESEFTISEYEANRVNWHVIEYFTYNQFLQTVLTINSYKQLLQSILLTILAAVSFLPQNIIHSLYQSIARRHFSATLGNQCKFNLNLKELRHVWETFDPQETLGPQETFGPWEKFGPRVNSDSMR